MKITFPMALLLLFVGLKLGHVMEWSWWWVFSPLWITLPLAFVFVIVSAIVQASRR